MYMMENVVRNYAWGSTTALAALLGRAESGQPEAELWMGAHPDSPSEVLTPKGVTIPLDALISADPVHFLGAESVERFGPRLPFLAKILAAAQPLSLQVHPNAAQAKAGFQRENSEGLPPGAHQRSYRDDNHKPEMIFALTHFEALCGFRPVTQTRRILARITALMDQSGVKIPPLLSALTEDLSNVSAQAGLKNAFTRLVTGGPSGADGIESLVAALDSDEAYAPFEREVSTVRDLQSRYPNDPGVLISLLLNRVSLAPGEAIYLPAGNVHAYLSGLGIEVMASSDNVLRGGLTPKYVNVPELLHTVDFSPVAVPRIGAAITASGQEIYRPPFPEFQLQRIALQPASPPVRLAQSGASLLIAVTGSARLSSGNQTLHLTRGSSAFIPASQGPTNLRSDVESEGPVLVFVVTTGL